MGRLLRKPSGPELYSARPLGYHHCSPTGQNNWGTSMVLGCWGGGATAGRGALFSKSPLCLKISQEGSQHWWLRPFPSPWRLSQQLCANRRGCKTRLFHTWAGNEARGWSLGVCVSCWRFSLWLPPSFPRGLDCHQAQGEVCYGPALSFWLQAAQHQPSLQLPAETYQQPFGSLYPRTPPATLGVLWGAFESTSLQGS